MAKTVNEEREGETRSLALMYAYRQMPLHPDTANHCNFQIIGRIGTGNYKFETGYFGLTITPKDFQEIKRDRRHRIEFD